MGDIFRSSYIHFAALIIFTMMSSFAKAPSAYDDGSDPTATYHPILDRGLSNKALLNAIDGYAKLKKDAQVTKDILVVIDYTKSSNTERFYILDMSDTTLTQTVLVAHGRNSGNEYATSFSNVSGSYMSSQGFFKTAETYQGKHGLSLRLDGLEYGINHLARERAIVIHQADYVSLEFAAQHQRIGRSLGCPALPTEGYEEIIQTIKDGCLLYIYGGDDAYAGESAVLSDS